MDQTVKRETVDNDLENIRLHQLPILIDGGYDVYELSEVTLKTVFGHISCEKEDRNDIFDANVDEDVVVEIETLGEKAREKESVMSSVMSKHGVGDETQDPLDPMENNSPPNKEKKVDGNLAEASKKVERPNKKDGMKVTANTPQNDAEQEGESDCDSSSDNEQDLRIRTKKRHPWSQEEMDYIRDGVKRFGVGNWASIRDYYPFPTEHHNSVKIKDKFRHMLLKREIEAPKTELKKKAKVKK
jgi:hypothetical protein